MKEIRFIKLKKYTTSIGILFLCNFSSQAQTLTLPQILEYSKQNYPSIKAKQARLSSAENRIHQSQVSYLPTIVVQDQYTYATYNNMLGSFSPNEAIGISTTGAARPEDTYQGIFGSLASIAVDWKVFNFGKTRADVNASRQDKAIAEADLENEFFQHQIRVIDTYLSLLEAQKIARAQESNLQRASYLKEVVKAGTNSGIRPGVDSSLANAEYSKASLQLTESRRNEKLLGYKLAQYIGEPDKAIAIDTSVFRLQFISDNTPTTSNSHPVINLYNAQINSSMARAKAARLTYMPSLSFVAAGLARGFGVSRTTGQETNDFSSATSYELFNYLAGFSLKWNITGIIRQHYDYGAEKYQIERFKAEHLEQQIILRRQQKEADAQLEFASEQVKQLQIQLQASRDAFAQAEARYISGMSDIIMLNQSFYLLNRSEVSYNIAVNNSWKSLLIKSAAAGDLSIFLNKVQ